MADFYMISVKLVKKDVAEISPKFIINNHSSDLMIKGGDFEAVYLEDKGLWSTNEQDVVIMVDRDIEREVAKFRSEHQDIRVVPKYMWDGDSGSVDRWHKYCKQQCRDSFHELDNKLTFSNDITTKEDYISKRLPYPLEESPIPGYEKLIGTLYSPEERAKIEWAIGSVIAGDSKTIQKFVVLYGSAGTGKSTILNIIQMLFEGYYSTFDAKALGSSSNAFALEAFRDNPLVAIQHDGDLSRIEDNTRLNSLTSHEFMLVNEKFKTTYSQRFRSFLFMGTNKPVRITDAKSGLIRRLIDVSPSGKKVPVAEYRHLMKQIEFELGGIAWHCLKVYEEDPGAYDSYIPKAMLGATNDFYNYILENYYDYESANAVTLKQAWERYNTYCEKAKVPNQMPQRIFKEELRNYFKDFDERKSLGDGTRVWNYYSGFRTDIFEMPKEDKEKNADWIELKEQASVLDDICADCPAQYASAAGTPSARWADVKTTLKDLDTSKLHYAQLPKNHIFIDLDLKDENGNKSLERNLKEANKWPPTYAELSKGGQGLHLHYIYLGDPEKLKSEYTDDVEIKIFKGNSALRRKLSRCNDIPIATISSGLPLKEEVKKKEKDMAINYTDAQFEKGLITSIKQAVAKEVHPGTKPSIDWIKKMLDDAYESGRSYDVSSLKEGVIDFAMGSTNHRDYCLEQVWQMKFKSDDKVEPIDISEETALSAQKPLTFYDVECYPNLFLICWKYEGDDRNVVVMLNPTPEQVEELFSHDLGGFNNRGYDNHMIYGRWRDRMNNAQSYILSSKIIGNDPNAKYGGAYGISKFDIFDFSSVKQSLKKFQIELAKKQVVDMRIAQKLNKRGLSMDDICERLELSEDLVRSYIDGYIPNRIKHQEINIPWDQPVPDDMIKKVIEYCTNDVISEEEVFKARKPDWIARQILADISGLSTNDTNNQHSTRIIFGDNRHPQSEFNYRNMGEMTEGAYRVHQLNEFNSEMGALDPMYTVFDAEGRPIFPGYTFDEFAPKDKKSVYRGEYVGEGGYVYAEQGMWGNVALLDVASMHPSSIRNERLFGPYTDIFGEIMDARIAIKHKDFEKAKTLLGGKLAKYLDDPKIAKDLAQALKIVINSVYGLTAAHFENPFADPRNKDNIVAKRGALFMINLKHEVQRRGFKVCHIKTDSIKIPDATPEIIEFVMEYGKLYGYNFEHEETYDRMCLVNDAVYIAKYKEPHIDKRTDEEIWWTATGTQFQVPYVFKTLFSKEEIIFEDMCETKSVSKGALYLDMNEKLPDVTSFEKEYTKEARKDCPDEGYLASLEKQIEKGHNYIFVGRVGQFCPIREGCGGGVLYRVQDGKNYAAAGTKGYRWLESETVRMLDKEDCIDEDYYRELVTEAAQTIIAYGDLDWFVSDRPYIPPKFENGHPVYPEPVEYPPKSEDELIMNKPD